MLAVCRELLVFCVAGPGRGRPLRVRSVDDILAEVSRDRGVGVEEILGPSRVRRIRSARREFCVRAHKEAG